MVSDKRRIFMNALGILYNYLNLQYFRLTVNNSERIEILLGNSADPSNNHPGGIRTFKIYCSDGQRY